MQRAIVFHGNYSSGDIDVLPTLIAPYINSPFSGFEVNIEDCQNKSGFIKKCLELCLNRWSEPFETSLNNLDVSPFLIGTMKPFFVNSNETIFAGKGFSESELEASRVFARLVLLKAVYDYCVKHKELVDQEIIESITKASEILSRSYKRLDVVNSPEFFENSTVQRLNREAHVNFSQAARTKSTHQLNMKLSGTLFLLAGISAYVQFATDVDPKIKLGLTMGLILYSISLYTTKF